MRHQRALSQSQLTQLIENCLSSWRIARWAIAGEEVAIHLETIGGRDWYRVQVATPYARRPRIHTPPTPSLESCISDIPAPLRAQLTRPPQGPAIFPRYPEGHVLGPRTRPRRFPKEVK